MYASCVGQLTLATLSLETSLPSPHLQVLYAPVASMSKVPDAWDDEWSSAADVCLPLASLRSYSFSTPLLIILRKRPHHPSPPSQRKSHPKSPRHRREHSKPNSIGNSGLKRTNTPSRFLFDKSTHDAAVKGQKKRTTSSSPATSCPSAPISNPPPSSSHAKAPSSNPEKSPTMP